MGHGHGLEVGGGDERKAKMWLSAWLAPSLGVGRATELGTRAVRAALVVVEQLLRPWSVMEGCIGKYMP